MDLLLEERKIRYVESIQAAYQSPEGNSWWQHPAPIYHLTREYANQNDKEVETFEPVIFKTVRKEWIIIAVLLIVAWLLFYMVAENKSGFWQVMFLVLLLIVVVPPLLENRAKIRIGYEGIFLYKEEKDMSWENIVLTHFKEVREESSSFFLVIHYYDKGSDEFHQVEITVDGLASLAGISATIEAFRNSYQMQLGTKKINE